jgi:hypothetical protein
MIQDDNFSISLLFDILNLIPLGFVPKFFLCCCILAFSLFCLLEDSLVKIVALSSISSICYGVLTGIGNHFFIQNGYSSQIIVLILGDAICKLILLGTFFLTIIFDLTVAVQVGLVLACIFFIYRISSLTQIEKLELPEDFHSDDDLALQDEFDLKDSVAAYGIYGSLFFGAIDKIEDLIDPTRPDQKIPKVMILEMHQLINIDTSGIDALKALNKSLKKLGSTLIVCAANAQPASLMARSGFIDEIGEENCLNDLPSAFLQAKRVAADACKLNVGS